MHADGRRNSHHTYYGLRCQTTHQAALWQVLFWLCGKGVGGCIDRADGQQHQPISGSALTLGLRIVRSQQPTSSRLAIFRTYSPACCGRSLPRGYASCRKAHRPSPTSRNRPGAGIDLVFAERLHRRRKRPCRRQCLSDLPACVEDSATAASREPIADGSHGGGTETVLLVEDDLCVRVFAQACSRTMTTRFAPSAIRAPRSKPRPRIQIASMPSSRMS